MIDNFPSKLLSQSQTEQLARLEADYKIIFATLKAERGFRQTMKERAAADKLDYWQGRIDEAQRAIDALVRVKDIAKVLLLERNGMVAEGWKQEELIQDVEAKPVRLSY